VYLPYLQGNTGKEIFQERNEVGGLLLKVRPVPMLRENSQSFMRRHKIIALYGIIDPLLSNGASLYVSLKMNYVDHFHWYLFNNSNFLKSI